MERDNVRSYENLCKIFEMRIRLDRENKINPSEEVLANYEKYSKKIDSINNVEFQEKVKPLVKPASSLEKEKDRLEKLVFLLRERLSKRENLEDRYYNATGRYMRNIQPIVSESELNEKQDRLNLIERYFKNNKEIGDITALIAKLKNNLEEEEEKKDEYQIKNSIMEKELSSIFLDLIKKDEYYSNLDEENIDKELALVFDKVSEAKETLDVTKDSVSSLLVSGSSSEYSSYVDEAAKSYYVWKNRELILKIYLLVLETKESFLELYSKRNDIKDIIETRNSLRSELNIDTPDELSPFEKCLLEQIDTLEKEKDILENISNYSNKIKFKEEKLEILEEDNNSVEMLALLREYGIIDVYEADESNAPEEESVNDDSNEGATLTLNNIEIPIEDPIINEVIDPYRIISVDTAPVTLNVGLAKLKGDSIREKVNKKLNPETEKMDEVKVGFSSSNDSNLENNNSTNNFPWTSFNNSSNDESNVNNIDYSHLPPILSAPTNKEKIDNPNTIEMKIGQNDDYNNLTSNNEFNNKPLWDITSLDNDSLNKTKPLIWQVPTDDMVQRVNSNNQFAIEKEEDITKKENPSNSDTFWVPVDDGKLETNKFPNINIPIQTNFSETKDNFGFPNIEPMNNNYDFSTYGGDK